MNIETIFAHISRKPVGEVKVKHSGMQAKLNRTWHLEWRTRQGSNLRPADSKSDALSN
jgi:hypothetical protein